MKSPRALLGIPFLSVNENLYVFGVIKESDPSPPRSVPPAFLEVLDTCVTQWQPVHLSLQKPHIQPSSSQTSGFAISHRVTAAHQLKAQHAPSTESDVLQHYQCPLRLPCRVHLFIFILRMRKLRLGEVRRLPRLLGWSW